MVFRRLLTILLAGLIVTAAHAAVTVMATCAGGGGAPGEVCRVSVALTNDVALSGLQLEIAVNGCAEAVAGSTRTLGRASAHSATAGNGEDGSLRLLVYSPGMATISAGEGTVAEFDIRMGDAPAAMQGAVSVKAVDAAGRSVAASGEPMPLTVSAARAEFPAGIEYDFGRIPLQASYDLSIPLNNTGTAPLTVTRLEFSSPDFVCATPLPLTVEAGASSVLQLTYTPSKRGTYNHSVTIHSNSTASNNVLRLLSRPYAVNELHVGDVSGVSDTEVTIPLSVNNQDPVTGFTFEFRLPEQLQYVDGSFQLTDRADDHSVVASCKDGLLHATAYSLADKPFKGHDGVLATFRVRLSGKYGVTLEPAKTVLPAVIEGEITDVTSDVYGGYISIAYPSIDVTRSFFLGRTPITETAEQMLNVNNYGNAPLVIDRMDIEGFAAECPSAFPITVESWSNAQIPVRLATLDEGSLSGTIRIYCNDPDNRMVPIALTANRYAPNYLTPQGDEAFVESGKVTLVLQLSNYDPIAGVQFDAIHPDGFMLASVKSAGRADGYSAQIRKIDAATDRVFVYTVGGVPIVPGEGEVLTLEYEFTTEVAPDYYSFAVDAVKLSDAAMRDRNSDTSRKSVTLLLRNCLYGDANDDGRITQADVTAVIAYILEHAPKPFNAFQADVNRDGRVSVADVTMITDLARQQSAGRVPGMENYEK